MCYKCKQSKKCFLLFYNDYVCYDDWKNNKSPVLRTILQYLFFMIFLSGTKIKFFCFQELYPAIHSYSSRLSLPGCNPAAFQPMLRGNRFYQG